jgi:hypothetical protein
MATVNFNANVHNLIEVRQALMRIQTALDPSVKNNFTATANPAVTDDSGDGYSVGSVWINLTLDRAYLLTDAAAGAANWLLLAPEGGSGPADAKYIVQQAHPDLSAEQALGALATGILKSTTGTGVVSIAVAGTDYAAGAHTHPLADITDEGALAALNTVGTAQIDNDAVTYAKMQNVSAASRLLGRGSAAGAGDVQELTLEGGLSMSGTAVRAPKGEFHMPFFASAVPVAIT